MINKNVIFVGDRFFALQEILKVDNWYVTIFAVSDSYLEKELLKRDIPYVPLNSKESFIKTLKQTNFDLFISNGCPYILPISEIKKNNQEFINIHPSYLPDLRGKNPINAAILLKKDIGATCHVMDDSVDNGSIISRVKIPYSDDLDLGLLYQLCFMAEIDVFKQALSRNFKPQFRNIKNKSTYEYTRKKVDTRIDFYDEPDMIVRRIKAFASFTQGAWFVWNNITYKVMDAEKITNRYLLSKIGAYKDCEIISIYDNTVVIKKGKIFLKLKGIIGDIKYFSIGDILSNKA